MTPGLGFEQWPIWCEATALTTEPYLLPGAAVILIPFIKWLDRKIYWERRVIQEEHDIQTQTDKSTVQTSTS